MREAAGEPINRVIHRPLGCCCTTVCCFYIYRESGDMDLFSLLFLFVWWEVVSTL